MARGSLLALSLVAALCATTASAAVTGKASGTLTINGRTAKLAYAYAHLETNPLDDSDDIIVVTLSETQLPPDAVNDLTKLDHNANVLVFRINDDQEVIGGEIHATTVSGRLSSIAAQRFEPTVFTAERIAGKLYTAQADNAFGTTYQYSATFDVAVAPNPSAPHTLAPGVVVAERAGEPAASAEGR